MRVLNRKKVTARKIHTCSGCNREIKVGDTYTTSFTTDYDQSWTWKECSVCSEFIPKFVEVYSNDGYSEDDVYETALEICIDRGFFRDGTLNSHSPAWEMIDRIMKENI